MSFIIKHCSFIIRFASTYITYPIFNNFLMKYYTFLLVIFQLSSYSQNITFLIKDKSTNIPISFVAISTQSGNGTYSDENGRFDIAVSSKDTLLLSHVSYQNIKFSKKSLDDLKESTIFLVPKITELNEVRVNPVKFTKLMLGYYNEKTSSARPGPGGGDFNIYVNHLKNIKQNYGYIEKLYFDLSLKLTDRGKSKARVRVFSVGLNGLPKDDILHKEIIKIVDKITPNIKVDISDLKIVFPPEGVFIGLEFFCNFEAKQAIKMGYVKVKTNCPHISTAKVSNYEEIGNSYFWSTTKGEKLRWVCNSNGIDYKAFRGQVFKFGAFVSQ